MHGQKNIKTTNKVCVIRPNKMHFPFLIYFNNLSSTCFNTVKVQVKVAFWSFFNTEAIWPIAFLLPTSSRIHLQRRHASYRRARLLPAKAGTITKFC